MAEASAEIRSFVREFDFLAPDIKERVRERLMRAAREEHPELSQDRFLAFVATLWPQFIHGRHHDVMADAFERIAAGSLKRVIINMPPRSTKSKFASVFFPAWYLGRYPERKVFEASHTVSLAMDFGRELRNLISREEYQHVFPGVKLQQDARAAHRWLTSQGGEYFAIGKTGGAAGRGGDLIIIDDPHSEQDVLTNPKAEFEKTWKWYLAGPRQRLQPKAAILVVMTRWGLGDLTGQLIRQATEDEDGEQWELIELPAILPSGESLFPGFWDIAELRRTRATLTSDRWMANYQQKPTSEEAAIIKREYWRDWIDPEPPSVDFVVQSWDTAFSDKDNANRSACITWGVFHYWTTHDDRKHLETGVIMLDAKAGRWTFPELKEEARRLYDEFHPDSLVIERKASGGPLIQELYRAGIYVTEMNPHRSNDKHVRTNAVADLFHSGVVWAPFSRRWAREVREEMAAWPHGEYDDYHDAAVWGLLRIRQGNLIRLGSDVEDEEWKPRPPVDYY